MKHWIQYKFRFNGDPDSPDWWLDLFLIDTAFREVIEKHKPEMWRFHRRSAKDSVGHQLSLLVYIDKREGENIFIELRLHRSVKLLDERKHLKSTSIEMMEPGIEKTSDPGWSEPLQESWPYFACGACQMILGLIDNDFKGKSVKYIQDYYTNLSNELEDTFTSIGSHAFIHHLSALFGYAPIKLEI